MIRNLLTPAVLLSAAFASSASAAITDNLVVYYDFEDLNNAPGLTGPNATEAGTGSYTGVAGGIVGNAAEFTGTTNDRINTQLGFGGGTNNQLGNTFTVSAWYNVDTDASSGASRFFVFEGDTDYDISYGLRALSGATGFNDSQTFTNTEPNDLSTNHIDVHTQGTWQHVVLTYVSNGTNTSITTYIDGIFSGSVLTPLTSQLASDGINIGNARNSALNRAFDGKIDEFAAWNRELSVQEILDVRAAGLAGQPIPEPGSLALLGLGGLAILSRRRRA